MFVAVQDRLTSLDISYVLSVSRCSPQPAFLPYSRYLRIPIDDSLSDDLLPWIPQALHFIGEFTHRTFSTFLYNDAKSVVSCLIVFFLFALRLGTIVRGFCAGALWSGHLSLPCSDCGLRHVQPGLKPGPCLQVLLLAQS